MALSAAQGANGDTPHRPFQRFDAGMARDLQSFELPDGYCYDAQNLLCDYAGKIRKRGGTTVPSATNRTAVISRLSGLKSGSLDGLAGLVGTLGNASGATAYSINRSTGAATSILSSISTASLMAKPFQHRSYMVLPLQHTAGVSGSENTLYFWGGSTASNQSGANGVVTLGSNAVSGMTSGTLTSANIGQFLHVSRPGTPQDYLGRIIAVDSGTSVRVEPTPTVSFTGTTWSTITAWTPDGILSGIIPVPVGKYACSYQGRIVQANIAQANGSTGSIEYNPTRVMWSKLQSEDADVTNFDGDKVLYPSATAQQYNYVDFPAARSITGLVTAGENQLIVFSDRATFRITGTLDSESVANTAFDFSAGQASANVGCVDSGSIQYTKGGIVFAAYDNLYQFDGSAMRPLLSQTNSRYYQSLVGPGGVSIYGSAYFLNQNHYYLSLSGSQGGLMVNLDTNALVREVNPAMQVFDSAPDPVNATQLWGTRWWDTTTTAPTLTNGFLHRLDPIFVPAQSNASDGDGTAVIADFQSASYTFGAIPPNKMPSDLNLTYRLIGTGSPTVTLGMDTKLETSDASYVTVSSTVPNTGSVSLSKNYPAGTLLTEGQGLQVRLTTNAACAQFELAGLDFGIQTRPDQFST